MSGRDWTTGRRSRREGEVGCGGGRGRSGGRNSWLGFRRGLGVWLWVEKGGRRWDWGGEESYVEFEIWNNSAWIV